MSDQIEESNFRLTAGATSRSNLNEQLLILKANQPYLSENKHSPRGPRPAHRLMYLRRPKLIRKFQQYPTFSIQSFKHYIIEANETSLS